MTTRSQLGSATMLGTLLAGLVIAGLLHFPSTCVCGARLPHTHSLFQLAGHHHDHRANQPNRAPAAAVSRATQTADGPQLVQPGNSEVKSALYVAAAAGPAQVAGRSLRRRVNRASNQQGQVVTPEPGPPKVARRAVASADRAQP